VRRGTAVVGTLVAAVALVGSWRAGTHASSGVAGVHVVAAPSQAPPAAPSTTTPSSGSSGSTPALQAARRWTGAVVGTPYGDVQVVAVTKGQRITDVRAVHLTDANQHSRDISASAAPTLRQEALQAQSARIDTVSGATYTSEGYRQSLQAALDQMHG
jgi:uncharacterized protein with FMN-binding domain